jgi:FixJ family two-component response regulator
MRPTILIVDDDVDFLNTICYEFEDFFDFEKCNSAEQAIGLLEKNPDKYGVILSDEKMPFQSGVEFLKICSEKWPDKTRVMMTGQMNNEQLLKCINEVGLFGFVTKDPSNDDFEEVFIDLLNRANKNTVSNSEFSTNVNVKTDKTVQDIYEKRLKIIAEIVAFFSYEKQTLVNFEKALKEISTPKNVSWADIALLDKTHEKEFFESFRKVIATQLITMFHKVSASILPEYICNRYKEQIQGLQEIELILISVACDLLVLCKSEDHLELTIDKGELIIKMLMPNKFGVSILNVMCDNYSETALKNALLFYLVAITTKKNGRVEIKHDKELITVLITNPISNDKAVNEA